MSTLNVGTVNVSGRVSLPAYTTAQRDNLVDVASGQMIYNSSTQSTEVYNGTTWIGVTAASTMVASGGNSVLDIAGYKVHVQPMVILL
jgi:hypothetical protein